MVWQSLWETSKDTDEFWAASLDYGNRRWGTAQTSTDANTTWQTNDSGWVTMRRAGNQVLWMMTPSSSIQSELLTRLGTFGS
jgi:Flp pilus assembly protein TadG